MFKFCSMFYSSGKLIFSLVTLYKNVTLVKNCIVLSLQVCAVEICARIMMSEAGCFFSPCLLSAQRAVFYPLTPRLEVECRSRSE